MPNMARNGPLLAARLLALLIAVPLHEFSHGYASYKLGDPTAKNAGRLTLNPIKHIDIMGLAAMFIIGIGWAKPVPINPRYYKNRKLGTAVTAAAGPLSNIALALLTLVLFKFASYGAVWYQLAQRSASPPQWMLSGLSCISYFVSVNIMLFLFNLLPVPPLDGSRILGLLLPRRANDAIMRVERYIFPVLLAALFILPYATGADPLGYALGSAAGGVRAALDALTGWVDALCRARLSSF